jgi:CO/xanthine dehydrogenase Mo-binding subunit
VTDHGRGIAFSARHVGRGKTSLTLTLSADGSVEVLTGVADQGGGAHTMIQRVVARELGIDVSRVRVRRGDTGHANVDPGVGGSRVTPVAGNAALDGARKLKARLAELSLTLDEAARTAAPLVITGVGEQNEHLYGVYGYSIEVSVDRETGSFRIVDAVLVADVGTVINPVAVRGQLEGGFVFGLGQAVMEELRVEDGRVTTARSPRASWLIRPSVPRSRMPLTPRSAPVSCRSPSRPRRCSLNCGVRRIARRAVASIRTSPREASCRSSTTRSRQKTS